MMNFLPEENKKEIQREYFRRLVVISGFSLFFTILFGIVIILLLFFVLKDQQAGVERQLAFSEQKLSQSGAGDIVPLIKDLNDKIKILKANLTGINEKSVLIKNIISKKPKEIKINEIFFDEDKILIKGLSETRNALIAFINSLKTEKSFEKVDSPLANFLSEKNIEFSIEIKL